MSWSTSVPLHFISWLSVSPAATNKWKPLNSVYLNDDKSKFASFIAIDAPLELLRMIGDSLVPSETIAPPLIKICCVSDALMVTPGSIVRVKPSETIKWSDNW